MSNGNRCPQTVFLPKSDPKMSTVAQNIGGVGVQIGRVVGKTSEMGSLVALRMLRNFLGQPITNRGEAALRSEIVT